MHSPSAAWRHLRWLSLCLFLLVAACAPASAPSAIVPMASGPARAATIAAYHGHTSTIFAVAWSTDGRRIASASQDGMVQVWDAASGHHLLTYRVHTRPVWAIAWSPSGVCIASATGNTSYEYQMETVQVWNATTGHRLISYLVPSTTVYADGTFSVAWSPDSTHIATGGADTMVHLWSVPSSLWKPQGNACLSEQHDNRIKDEVLMANRRKSGGQGEQRK